MKKYRNITHLLMLLFPLLLLAACSSLATFVNKGVEIDEIILATTTSTRDSGLLDALIPGFEEQSGYRVKTVAVGTGKALKMGEQGDADVLLVHAPPAEEAFMNAGYGSERFLVMHNDFVIAGPAQDPAGVKGFPQAAHALKRIADQEAVFVSRGDDSGTNKKETSLWEETGTGPGGDWYLESGQAMGASLQIASAKEAYTLTDRATFLAHQDTLNLAILVEGDPDLLNIYHVIIVNAKRWPKVNQDGARALAAYLISPEVQAVIGKFGVDEYGQALFTPDAHKEVENLGLD